MAGFDFLVNAVAGLAANSLINSAVGIMTGVGAAIALHPVLIASGLLLGGTAIATMRSLIKKYERPALEVIQGGLE
ncbi:unknown protein (plasmid) [Calothrix sp. PCC 7716]|nr:unknown protein [Calothrix sp. PCC 7716]